MSDFQPLIRIAQQAAIAYREGLRLRRHEEIASGISAGQIKHQADIEAARLASAHIREEKAARTLAYIAAENDAFRGKAACFVAASRKVMTVEQRREVWDRAREMFPDDPCWTENREETRPMR